METKKIIRVAVVSGFVFFLVEVTDLILKIVIAINTSK